MHLYALTRGAKHEVDRMITELQGVYLPIVYNKEKMAIAMGVRPIQLWELVFPEPQLETVLKSLNMGLYHEKEHKKYVWALRKILGADAVPTIDKKVPTFPIYHSNVEIVPIGTKKDIFINGNEQL